MTRTPGHDRITSLTAALPAALADRNVDAFIVLLTEDVRWGSEHGGTECSNRIEVNNYYAGLVAAGVTVRITDIHGEGDNLTAKLRIESPNPEEYPKTVSVRLTVRDGLIADILELEPPPRIELLYIDDCPNHETFLPHLRQLLHDHDIDAALVSLVRIEGDDDAQTHRFLGSPTLRINGLDVEPAALDRHSYALQCRRYITPDGITGTPADRWIIDALQGNPNQQLAIDAIPPGM